MLRKEFSLINSKFNEFLFAPVGEEANGMTLSVMSAFSRLGMDPWREAALLADLPKDKAIESLAPTIARFSEARWAQADTQAIATRLIAFLPRIGIIPSRSTAAAEHTKPNARTTSLLIFLIASAVFFTAAAAWRQASQSDGGVATETSAPSHRVEAPIGGSQKPD